MYRPEAKGWDVVVQGLAALSRSRVRLSVRLPLLEVSLSWSWFVSNASCPGLASDWLAKMNRAAALGLAVTVLTSAYCKAKLSASRLRLRLETV